MKNGSVKIQDAENAKYNKGCFPYGNKNTYTYFRKEVDCDEQGEDRKYWLKIEQLLPRMFYQISSSS